MKKGVILEIEGRFMTMLTPEGEFLRALYTEGRHQIGEEIYFYPVETAEKVGKGLISRLGARKKLIAAAALACLLVLSLVMPFNNNSEVYAYMTIDVNPSIELAVDKELSVVELHSYNQEGRELLNLMENWKGKSAGYVTRKILSLAQQQGYLKEHEEMIIASVLKKEVSKDSSESKKLNNQVEAIKETAEAENLEVKVVEATEGEREKAKEKGLTAGKFKEEEIERKQQLEEREREKEENAREKAENIKRKQEHQSSGTADEAKDKKGAGYIKSSSQLPKGSVQKQEGKNREADRKNDARKAKPEKRQDENKGRDKQENKKEEQRKQEQGKQERHEKHEKKENNGNGKKGSPSPGNNGQGNGNKGHDKGQKGNNGKSG
ncbi:anti-sigma factor domain-containing protein [Bacillus infantis]|uniref:anti-sigma factor domain-containing protein n=1 Tax=Bacillus infantis TaxID=324767 RepID=UPI001CD699B2|nr:anti-sigma factor domain-containing protein [Bacillus infantis]MCA1039658.1 anti-sigma factor domain-containing protein [Bacillus infantis]